MNGLSKNKERIVIYCETAVLVVTVVILKLVDNNYKAGLISYGDAMGAGINISVVPTPIYRYYLVQVFIAVAIYLSILLIQHLVFKFWTKR